MLANLALSTGNHPTLSRSRASYARILTNLSGLLLAFVGSDSNASAIARIQDHVSQPSIIGDPELSQNRTVCEIMDETFAREREPYSGVAQPGRVTRRDDCLADVKMVTVCDG